MSELVRTPDALRERCDRLRTTGLRIGLVPTMGALHAGHISLCEAARARGAQQLVVSIFVNPLQFGQKEDFGKYPRTLDQDLALCEHSGIDLVYAPELQTMYPPSFQAHVEVERLAQGFEGAARPTHFRGVTTVVAKLFNAVGPCIAAFGRKDYQQWRVIERMARDLDMPVDVIGCPILREPDGLALSSRNRYLDPSQRRRAVGIFQGLKAADAAYRAGERNPGSLEALARAPIVERFDAVDYVSVAHGETLQPISPDASLFAPWALLVSARLGATRLIDNAVLGVDAFA